MRCLKAIIWWAVSLAAGCGCGTPRCPGAIYGFESSTTSHTLLRPSPKSPVPGLFYVGAWTNPGGGYWPAMSSGQMIGEIMASKLGGEDR